MNIAAYIDHTFLKPQGTEQDILRLCREAREYSFYSVCVNSCWIELCRNELLGSSVKISAVIGFPLGAMDSRSKAMEAAEAVSAGADELDMVMNIGFLKSGFDDMVVHDIREVLDKCNNETVLKVIIENCLLEQNEKIKACELVKKSGAHFVKTSTGFNGEGATTDDVALMRKTVGAGFGVKAAGGVRSYQDAIAMINAGADRIGTSGGVQIISGQKHSGAY